MKDNNLAAKIFQNLQSNEELMEYFPEFSEKLKDKLNTFSDEEEAEDFFSSLVDEITSLSEKMESFLDLDEVRPQMLMELYADLQKAKALLKQYDISTFSFQEQEEQLQNSIQVALEASTFQDLKELKMVEFFSQLPPSFLNISLILQNHPVVQELLSPDASFTLPGFYWLALRKILQDLPSQSLNEILGNMIPSLGGQLFASISQAIYFSFPEDALGKVFLQQGKHYIESLSGSEQEDYLVELSRMVPEYFEEFQNLPPPNYRENSFSFSLDGLQGKTIRVAGLAGPHNNIQGVDATFEYLKEQADVSIIIGLHESKDFTEQAQAYGLTYHYYPILDFVSYGSQFLQELVDIVREAAEKGEKVAVHCGAGNGRTGTVLAALKLYEYLTKMAKEHPALLNIPPALSKKVLASYEEVYVPCTPLVHQAITAIRTEKMDPHNQNGVASVETPLDIQSLMDYEAYVRAELQKKVMPHPFSGKTDLTFFSQQKPLVAPKKSSVAPLKRSWESDSSGSSRTSSRDEEGEGVGTGGSH